MDCFFIYKGKRYLKDTIVRLNKDFVKEYCGQDCVIARACFRAGTYFLFDLVGTASPATNSEYTVFVAIDKMENIIEEIIEPHEPEIKKVVEVKQEKYYDWDYTGLLTGWVIYIFFMCLLCIFNDRITGWIGASIVFFSWRHDKLKPYRKNK